MKRRPSSDAAWHTGKRIESMFSSWEATPTCSLKCEDQAPLETYRWVLQAVARPHPVSSHTDRFKLHQTGVATASLEAWTCGGSIRKSRTCVWGWFNLHLDSSPSQGLSVERLSFFLKNTHKWIVGWEEGVWQKHWNYSFWRKCDWTPCRDVADGWSIQRRTRGSALCRFWFNKTVLPGCKLLSC